MRTTEDILLELDASIARASDYKFDSLERVFELSQRITKMMAYRKHRLDKRDYFNPYFSEDDNFHWYVSLTGMIDNRYFSYTFYKTIQTNECTFQIPHTSDVQIDELLKIIGQYESLDRW
jgi:hypothetical protein